MTTILDLTEEILLNICEQLPRQQVAKIQYLCRQLYRPAHLTLLKKLDLRMTKIASFNESIDHNPDPTYIRTVKEISLIHQRGDKFEPKQVKQLFFRFPSLTRISIKGASTMLKGFTDKFCRDILTNCPKLDTFEASLNFNSLNAYCDTMYKVRLLQTIIDLAQAENTISKYGGVQGFVPMFPRLQKIHGFSVDYCNFEKILDILRHTPDLREIWLIGIIKDKEGFAERFFEAQSMVREVKIKKTLSKITDLHLKHYYGACEHAMKFIAEHCTGLERFSITNHSDHDKWNKSEKEAFVHILNILGSVKSGCSLKLYGMDFEDLSRHFADITQKIFVQIPFCTTSRKRMIKLNFTCWKEFRSEIIDEESIEIFNDSNKWTSERELKIDIGYILSLQDLFNKLFTPPAPLDYIDSFELCYSTNLKFQDNTPTSIDLYEKLFEAMPMLKEAFLDIPINLTADRSTSTSVYPRLEDLTLRGPPDTNIEPVLERCGTAFPNLKALIISYWAGVWNEDTHEFQIELPNNALDVLAVDATVVKTKTTQKFFVLDVYLMDKEKHQLYKVALNFSSIVSTTDDDLKNVFNGQDYVRMKITVKSLKNMVLYMYNFNPRENAHKNYFDWADHSKQKTINLQTNKVK